MEEMTLAQLKVEAQSFAHEFSLTPIALLYGVTDGKAVGTYIEQAFSPVSYRSVLLCGWQFRKRHRSARIRDRH